MRAECEASGREDIWAVFHQRVLAPAADGERPVAYQHLAESPNADARKQAANLLVTGKRMFARSLRAIIGEYVEDEQMVDVELKDLQRALSRAAR